MKPGRTLAVRLRPETWSRVEPPEEVCKPDSVLPPRKREQQPFVWSPGCPGDRATDPRERTGSPRPTSRPGLPLRGLAPGGVYRASALTSGPGELLPHRFTIAPRLAARGCLLSVALSPDRSGPPLAATLPCGVRTFLPPRGAASDCSTSSRSEERRVGKEGRSRGAPF